MRTPRSKAIIRKIAESEGLTIKQVEEIVNSFFRYTAKKIKEGDGDNYIYKTIRLFKFGLFKVKQAKINFKKGLYDNYEKPNRDSKRSTDNSSGSTNDKGIQKNMGQGQINKKRKGS